MKHRSKRFLSILLSLVMVLGIMPGMTLTALAWEGDPYAALLNTTTVVNFDGKEWYLIENNSTALNAGTVTLLSKECVGGSAFDSNNASNTYNGSTVETYVNNWYENNISLNAKTAVSGGMFLLTLDQANAIKSVNVDVLKCSWLQNEVEYNVWWLCTSGWFSTISVANVSGANGDIDDSGNDAGVVNEVRPALKLDLSKVTFDSTTKTFSVLKKYNLWVGDTQVTSANATDTTAHPTWSYAADTNTLTLNNFSYTGAGGNGAASIFADNVNAEAPLTINLVGENTVVNASSSFYSYGIRYVNGSNQGLIISGEGSLNVSSANEFGYGIFAVNNDVTISGGTVTASGGNPAISVKNVTISGGTVIASCSGNRPAITGTVKNAIAGMGWTNPAGTEGKADIAISTEGQTLTYEKVRFPAEVAEVTTAPKANTLTYNGSAQKLVTAGAASGGTMQYALGKDRTTTPTDGWSTTIPSETNAGSYYVWYKVVGDSSHNDSAPASVPVTISKARINVIADPRSKSYGETAPALTYVSDSLAIGDSFSGKLEREAGEDAGIYEIQQGTLTAGDNYEITYVPANFTITKKIDPAHVHTLTKTEAVPATCETEGAEAYWTCSDCYRMFSDEQGSQEITAPVSIPALGHDWGEWTVTKEATEQEAGEETRTCQNDPSHVETRVIPALQPDDPTPVDPDPTPVDPDPVDPEPVKPGHDPGDHSLTDPRFPADGEDPVDPQQPDDPAPVDPKPAEPEEPTHNCPSAYYIDVDTSLWYHEAVDYVIENGLMNGFSDTEFRPDATLSRAMLATILYRLEGSPAVTGENPFTDVEADQWYTDAVIWASENGIVEGYGNDDFRPQRDVNRQEMAAMMMRYAEYKGIDVSVGEDTNLLDFNDVSDVSDWAVEAMQWAVGSGLIQGKNGGRLDPTGNTTRAQAATILMRFCENILK